MLHCKLLIIIYIILLKLVHATYYYNTYNKKIVSNLLLYKLLRCFS